MPDMQQGPPPFRRTTAPDGATPHIRNPSTLLDSLPFFEVRLKKKGCSYSKAANWIPDLKVDGLLVTGQKPASSTLGSEALLKMLRS
jgi:putative intracellular protease/amidase